MQALESMSTDQQSLWGQTSDQLGEGQLIVSQSGENINVVVGQRTDQYRRWMIELELRPAISFGNDIFVALNQKSFVRSGMAGIL